MSHGLFLCVWRALSACLLVLLLWQGVPAAHAAEPVARITGSELLDMVRSRTDKIVFINFFASWCPPCREEIPELIAVRGEYAEKDVLILGVSLDEDAAQLASFAADAGFNYPVYQAGPDIAPLFGITSIPHNSVYSGGRLRINEAGMVDAASLRVVFNALLGRGAASGGAVQ